ncbi:MAG: hypothetical protein H6585_14680 [Flavobacteriales bacterium]|nr:hypothetical protein [Flavobacteriales bacterium]MCB9449575.1 hypothetical protein [Flavobacteriales bacterium]
MKRGHINRVAFLSCFLALMFIANGPAAAITIKMKGTGGVVTSGNRVEICPQRSNDVCAVVQCGLVDCMVYVWNHLLGGGPSPVTEPSYSMQSSNLEDETGQSWVFRVTRSSFTDDQLIRGSQDGIQGSEVDLIPSANQQPY